MLPRQLLCAFRLFCVCLLGTRGAAAQEAGAQPELFIFDELCALKEDPGPCRALRDKYFFNVDTGRCELFEYGGCGGNANNFETLEACRETCLVSEDKNPCHLPEAEGPCRGLLTRYFFDNSTQQCKRFYYGGCFGNANNFRSMAECQAKCRQPGGLSRFWFVAPLQCPASFCSLLLLLFVCFFMLWAVLESQVQVQTGSGEIVDVPSTALTDAKLPDACSAPVEKGTCDGGVRRFAYHAEARRCQEFLYSGCGGNNNNFKHRRQCIRKCIKSQKDRGMKMIRIRKKNIPSILHGSV
ncbi:tissue factor pathway inhibitor a [Hippocampus zosterae]|uniref:tissue factor pathway inhibitor a n=1 Tax=Hippocampus zosterae TaxID=109293 RepID=UPI00223D763B|nr:tissue factor pathway inhibitor a [Hippocampus zosterae]